jgi:DNA-binding MarR family transcriptional regulator
MAREIEIPKEAIGEVTATCALFHSRRAARAITGTFDRHLKAAGVKATHFSLLALVAEAEGRTLSEIAAYMAMDRTALARELRALEDVGLLRIESPASDRRTRLMTLTKKGKALVVRALPLWRKAQNAVEAAMTDHSWPHVLRGMQIAAELG